MSFFERYVNSKFYIYTDIFFKILLLNFYMILTIIVGFFILGLPIAISSGAITLNMILKKTSTEVTKTYFDLLKKTYRIVMVKGLIFQIIIAILGFNVLYFYAGLEPFSYYYFIGFVISLWLFAFTIVAFYHGMILTIIYKVHWFSIIKHSYILTIGFGLRSMVMMVLGILYAMIVIWIPIIGVLIGFSGMLLLATWILNKPYQSIENLHKDLTECIDTYLQ
jgi:uncharacterized membrane protein YesL